VTVYSFVENIPENPLVKKYKINKTYQEINEKIKSGEVVVVTAEEVIDIVRQEGAVEAARHVDVVTTGTFSPMCSSGAFINFGQFVPGIRASKVWLNKVPAYAGLAAVDCFIGATELCEDDPLNKVYPGEFKYGGGHVIQELAVFKSGFIWNIVLSKPDDRKRYNFAHNSQCRSLQS